MTTSEAVGLPRGRALRRADLASMPDDGHRYELIDGVLVVSPAPTPRHQRVVFRLGLRLHGVCPAGYEVLPAPLDVVLGDGTVLQPDLLVARREDFTERDLPIAPLLAVEVLSSSTRGIDLLLKKDRLERAGCAHYWVVAPDEPSITAWSLTEGHYRQLAHATDTETFDVAEPFALSLEPAGLVD